MTASAFATQSNTTTGARRPAVDVAVQALAKSLLAWSDRRAARNQFTTDRMALVLKNQRTANRGGSPLGR